jgi:hypothetical protein
VNTASAVNLSNQSARCGVVPVTGRLVLIQSHAGFETGLLADGVTLNELFYQIIIIIICIDNNSHLSYDGASI